MQPVLVCVTGDSVVGRTQRITFTPSASMSTSLRRLTQALELEPADSTVTAVSLWDPDFDEYVKLDSCDEVANKSKLRVQTTAGASAAPDDNSSAVVEAAAKADAAIAATVEKLAGAEVAAAVRAQQQALQAVVKAVAAGSMAAADVDAAIAAEAKRPVKAAAARQVAEASRTAAADAKGDDDDEDNAPRRKKAAPPSRAAVTPPARAAATPPRKMSATNHNDITAVSTHQTSPMRRREPSPPRGANGPSSPRPVTTARAAATPTLGLGSSSQITVFCVYNGALAQRAKAVRVDRDAPNLAQLQRTLHEKFKSELALGYVEVGTGAFIEITESEHLAEIIARDCQGTDNLTLQCWRPDGLGDAAEAAETTRSARGGTTPGRGAVTPARPSAPSGAASVGTRLDVSGVAYSDEQLRELFNELDVDGSGYLDVDEFRAYYRQRFNDDMGVNDVDAKFEKMVAATPGFADGQLDFDEFSIVMLKLAQW